MPSSVQNITIETTPAEMMAVITDFASYPDFLPEMERAEVLLAEPGAWEVRFTVRVIRQLSYTLRLVQLDALTLQWSLLEGVFRSNDKRAASR
jgi:ribosome-associated toxin RatA of RatAB toxin-antitoxin module